VPDCLITGGQDYLMTPFVLGLYGQFSKVRTSGSVSAVVYCRQP
jgi:hypothetical protein